MKRTGIKATEDEVASLRAAASAPVMMVGGTTPRDPAAMAHEIALQHGLPEIPGFYGLDLATGEFLAADNAVLPSTLTDAVTPSARDRVEKVLGKAVHPLAIDRLLVLWPDVHVEVTHSDGYHDGVRSKVTRVSLFDRDPNGPEVGEQATGEARCRLDHDNWVKRRGITLAFNRAMKQVPRPSAG